MSDCKHERVIIIPPTLFEMQQRRARTPYETVRCADCGADERERPRTRVLDNDGLISADREIRIRSAADDAAEIAADLRRLSPLVADAVETLVAGWKQP